MEKKFAAATPQTAGGFFKRVANRVAAKVAVYKAEHRESCRRSHEQELRDFFQVRERDGRLWITCGGIAIDQLPDDVEAADVVKYLHNARNSAVNYENL
jgi:hypothetical protein